MRFNGAWFGFDVLQVPKLRHLQAGVLRFPNAVRRLADPMLATGLAGLRTGLDFFQHPDDLLSGELRLLHAERLGGETLLPSGSN